MYIYKLLHLNFSYNKGSLGALLMVSLEELVEKNKFFVDSRRVVRYKLNASWHFSNFFSVKFNKLWWDQWYKTKLFKSTPKFFLEIIDGLITGIPVCCIFYYVFRFGNQISLLSPIFHGKLKKSNFELIK